MEQLDFINHRNEPAFIVEKAYPLFYNPTVERNQLKKQLKKSNEKKIIKKTGDQENFTKEKKIKKPNKKYQTGILNINNINININNYNNYNNYNSNVNSNKGGFNWNTNKNPKGLFEPNLKLNE